MSDEYHIFNQIGKIIASDVNLYAIDWEPDKYILYSRDAYGNKTPVGWIPSNWAIINSTFINQVIPNE